MWQITLVKENSAAINISLMGCGVLLRSVGTEPPEAIYYENNNRAAEAALRLAVGCLNQGYSIELPD